MIPKKLQNDTTRCYACSKFINLNEFRYYIWVNPPSEDLLSISKKVVFHRECWRKIAGDEFLLEGC